MVNFLFYFPNRLKNIDNMHHEHNVSYVFSSIVKNMEVDVFSRTWAKNCRRRRAQEAVGQKYSGPWLRPFVNSNVLGAVHILCQPLEGGEGVSQKMTIDDEGGRGVSQKMTIADEGGRVRSILN